MSLGTDLKLARERAGLSIEELADRTKIQPHKIEALEEGNFEVLPYGIYLEGIVRSYGQELGLDAAPLVERLREERPPVVDDWNLALTNENPTNRMRIVPLEAHQTFDFSNTPDAAEPVEPVVRRVEEEPVRRVRGFAQRALPVVALLAVAGWSAFLYQLTKPLDRSNTHPAVRPPAAEEPPAGTASIPARPETEALIEPSVKPGAAISAAAPDPAQPTASPSPAAVPPPTPTSPIPAPTATDGRASAESAETVPSKHDVSGSWRLATNVATTSYAPFAGLRLGYELHLKQVGSRVEGEGRKVTENDAAIDSRGQTSISVTGEIAGDRLTLIFTEGGTRRTTVGKFVMLIEDGVMRGRFSSTAARSAGTVEARRIG